MKHLSFINKISMMMRWFISLDKLLDDHPPQEYPKMQTVAATEFADKCFQVLAIIKYINGHYAEHFAIIPGTANAKPLFNITIKCHSLTHIARNAEYMNPRLSICYDGEDYMKHMKQSIQSSIRGNTTVRCGRKLCEKIRLAIHTEFPRHQWLE